MTIHLQNALDEALAAGKEQLLRLDASHNAVNKSAEGTHDPQVARLPYDKRRLWWRSSILEVARDRGNRYSRLHQLAWDGGTP
jgi:hypothetical protein